MKRNIIVIFLLGIAVGIGVSFAGQKVLDRLKHIFTPPKRQTERKLKQINREKIAGQKSFESGIISTFETEDDIKKWSSNGVQLELTVEHPSEGERSLKIIYPQGGFVGLSAWRTAPSNWRQFDTLKFDVFNPQDEIVRFGVLIRDELGDSYPDRYDGYFTFKPGMNNFELNITGLKTNNKKRFLRTDRIKELVIFLNKPQKQGVLFLDNVRLVKKDEVMTDRQMYLLSNFERKSDFYKWRGHRLRIELANEHYSEGTHSLKVIFPPTEYPGLSAFRDTLGDWSKFDSLKFDVYNPQDEVIKFGILIKDEIGDDYPDRYDHYFAFKPGENNFELNITSLRTNNKKRSLKLDRIKQLTIFLFRPQKKYILYFDNFRLHKSQIAVLKNFYTFDFGTESSEVWPGFVQVTNKTKYDKKRGYGWFSTYGLKAKDRNYPDSLFRDWVQGAGPFNVDLPNGEYIVYMMLEDPGFWDYYQNYEKREVYAEDNLVVRDYLDSNAFFENYYLRHLNTEDLPRQDVWEKYVNARFTPKVFKVKVEDGQLNLSFSPRWGYACTLSTLIVYPSEYEREGAEYIQDLNKKRKRYFTTHFIETIPKMSELSFALTDADKKRGYILFSNNYLQKIYPNTLPYLEQIKTEISIFVTKGEYEPVSIAVYPWKDLGNSQLIVEELVDDKGNVISANNISVKFAQYKLKLSGKKVYEVRGELLRNNDKTDVKKGVTRQFWLTVKAPEDIPAGVYQGNIRFIPAQGQQQVITLNVKVLPFELKEADIAMGMFYFSPSYLNWYKDMRQFYWSQIEKQLWDLKEHNINSLAIDLSPTIKNSYDDTSVELSLGDFCEFIKLYKRFGFTKPIIGYGMIRLIKQAEKLSNGDEVKFATILKSSYQAIKNYVDEIYGPEIIFCLADEISNVEGKGIDYAVRLAQITQETSGIRTTALLNNRKDEIIFPYIDISTINNGTGISEQLLEKIRNNNSELWFYNIGKDRFSFGFYLAKTGAHGRLQWNYQLPAVDPYFDLDGRESDFCASYPSLDGPINSIWFEWIREGIDDYKYIATLRHYIKRAKESNNTKIIESAKMAEKILESILDNVQVEIYQNNWPLDEYDKKRWQIAEQIVKLIELLKKEETVSKGIASLHWQ
jgi:hypothetical protein